MSQAAHRIRRLRWHVRAESAAAALQWRTQLHTLQTDVQAALAQALDAQAPDGEVRHLERLHLQLRLPASVMAWARGEEIGTAHV